MRKVPGASWRAKEKWWTAPVASLRHVKNIFPKARYDLKERAEAKLETRKLPDTVPINESFYHTYGFLGVKLYPFQARNVRQMEGVNTVLLADEMGLGKTLQAIAWAHWKTEDGKKLIICPAAVRRVWRDEILRARPNDRVAIPAETGWHTAMKAEWVIVNYDVVWRGRTPDAIAEMVPEVVILDEAHYIKGMDTRRSTAAREIAMAAPFVMAVTGSPMPNGRPVELFPVLIALRRAPERKFWPFVRKFCAPYKDKWGFHYDGCANVEELNAFLSGFMVRNLKGDVLADLPPKHYSRMEVKLDNWAEYEKLEADHRKGQYGSRFDAYHGLAKLKQAAASGKVGPLAKRLELLVPEKQKAVVFCGYLAPLWSLSARLETLKVPHRVFTGEERPQDRHAAVREFAEDPDCLVALCSTMAMGTGVDGLQAANLVYFMDQPWTPAVKFQVEDRVHRIGQQKGVQVITVASEASIDAYLEMVLGMKGLNTDRAVDGLTEAESQRRVQAMYEEEE
jgi:SWI/SNF-related matrix-associated actin-dependent regulator 1 of chromatin subfamily A